MYTITLSNGKKLENLELNGNNFIASNPVDSAFFDGGLSEVTIADGSETRTYTDMVLLSNREEDGKSWFVLGEKSEHQKKWEALFAKLQSLEDAFRALINYIQR